MPPKRSRDQPAPDNKQHRLTVGSTIPHLTLRKLDAENQLKDFPLAPFFAKRKIALFGLPGAFTPTCSANHLPGFAGNVAVFKKLGVDEVVCITPNDPFVAAAWQTATGGAVTVIPDGSLLFTNALGLNIDLSANGLGIRMRRFSALVEDGVVKISNVEKQGTELEVSGAEALIEAMGGIAKQVEAVCS